MTTAEKVFEASGSDYRGESKKQAILKIEAFLKLETASCADQISWPSNEAIQKQWNDAFLWGDSISDAVNKFMSWLKSASVPLIANKKGKHERLLEFSNKLMLEGKIQSMSVSEIVEEFEKQDAVFLAINAGDEREHA
jgi:hypothetical protein